MLGCSHFLGAADAKDDLQSIFNGKDLSGWKVPADNKFWKVVDGVLVGENDVAGLAAALALLIRDPARRRVLGAAGEARVRAEFSLAANFERLARRFGLAAAHEDRVLRTA